MSGCNKESSERLAKIIQEYGELLNETLKVVDQMVQFSYSWKANLAVLKTARDFVREKGSAGDYLKRYDPQALETLLTPDKISSLGKRYDNLIKKLEQEKIFVEKIQKAACKKRTALIMIACLSAGVVVTAAVVIGITTFGWAAPVIVPAAYVAHSIAVAAAATIEAAAIAAATAASALSEQLKEMRKNLENLKQEYDRTAQQLERTKHDLSTAKSELSNFISRTLKMEKVDSQTELLLKDISDEEFTKAGEQNKILMDAAEKLRGDVKVHREEFLSKLMGLQHRLENQQIFQKTTCSVS
jgi:Sec-independent protein translocase protein TatA